MRHVIALLLLLPTLAAAEDKKGAQFAFLAGCSEYSGSPLRPRMGATDDIRMFGQALLETGFENNHVKMLHDKQQMELQPSKKNILKELTTLLDKLKPEDTVVVAFAGRGIHFKTDPTGYFCPSDANLKDKATLIPFGGDEGLYALLKKCKAKRKLLILDACRTDPTGGRTLPTGKLDLDAESPEEVPEGVVVVSSCAAGQQSHVHPKREHGIFFRTVAQAWRGEYAKEGKEPTLPDVFRSIIEHTKLDAEQIFSSRQPQTPIVGGKVPDEWLLPRSNAWKDYQAFDSAVNAFAVGKWLPEHAKKKFPEWLRLAENGSMIGMTLAGQCLISGVGVQKDEEAAVKWHRRAAEFEEAHSLNMLGVCRLHGVGGVEIDLGEADLFFRRSAERGNTFAMLNLGVMEMSGILREKNREAGIEWFGKAAKLGNRSGMFKFGFCLENGLGADKNEISAVEWYQKAAKLGDMDAMFFLGRCLEEGRGTDMDEKQAMEWYQKAADLGQSFAKARLKK